MTTLIFSDRPPFVLWTSSPNWGKKEMGVCMIFKISISKLYFVISRLKALKIMG